MNLAEEGVVVSVAGFTRLPFPPGCPFWGRRKSQFGWLLGQKHCPFPSFSRLCNCGKLFFVIPNYYLLFIKDLQRCSRRNGKRKAPVGRTVGEDKERCSKMPFTCPLLFSWVQHTHWQRKRIKESESRDRTWSSTIGNVFQSELRSCPRVAPSSGLTKWSGLLPCSSSSFLRSIQIGCNCCKIDNSRQTEKGGSWTKIEKGGVQQMRSKEIYRNGIQFALVIGSLMCSRL